MVLLGSVQHLKTCILLLASSSFSSRLIFINWRLLHLPVRHQNRQYAEELSLETILSILNWQNVSVNNLISHINDKSKFSPEKYQSHTHTHPFPVCTSSLIPKNLTTVEQMWCGWRCGKATFNFSSLALLSTVIDGYSVSILCRWKKHRLREALFWEDSKSLWHEWKLALLPRSHYFP